MANCFRPNLRGEGSEIFAAQNPKLFFTRSLAAIVATAIERASRFLRYGQRVSHFAFSSATTAAAILAQGCRQSRRELDNSLAKFYPAKQISQWPVPLADCW
jgi:hypothetical protein